MPNERTFSKQEIQKILNKASEIQTQKDLYGDRDGLSEDELLNIAQEVGIDQDSLLQALENFENPVLDSSFKWFSGSSKVQDISYVNGEVTLENWDDIVQEIRKVNGGIGKTSQIGASFEWEQRMKEIGYKHISFTPKDGKTKIQFVAGWSGLKLLSTVLPGFFGFVFGLIFLKGIGIPKDISVLFAPISALFGIGLGRVFLKSYFEKQKLILSSIKQSVSKLIRNTGNKSNRITLEEGAYTSEEITNTSSPGIKTS